MLMEVSRCTVLSVTSSHPLFYVADPWKAKELAAF
jgi:hypothetical protein